MKKNNIESAQKRSFYINPWYITAGISSVILFGLYLTTFYSYALFHTLAELFAIEIAVGVFMVAWNSRQFMRNNYFLFIGIALLFISIVDTLHTFSYKGIGIFIGFDANLPTQLWIAGRYLQAISFILAPVFLGRKLRTNVVLAIYTILTAFLLMSIFYWKIFPDAYIEGSGLTQFKIYSEYIISFLFILSAGALIKGNRYFDKVVLNYLVASIGVTVLSELFFTSYASVYGFSNMVGHFLRIAAFALLYKAVIEIGLRKPYNLLFRELKGSESRYRAVTESAHDAIISADTSGKIISWNKGANMLFGYREEEALGKPLTFLMPKEYQDKHLAGMQRFNKTKKSLTSGRTLEVEGVTKAGKNVPIELSLSSWMIGRKVFFTGIIRDISERKELEGRKDRFISIASHELKTPITSLMGFTQILAHQIKNKDISLAGTYLGRMNDQLRRLSLLVNDLLDVSKIQRDSLDLNKERFDLKGLVEETIENLQSQLNGHKVIFTKGKQKLFVEADRNRINQVLTNLILNAVKYSPNQDKVIVSIEQKNDQVITSITDFGIGVAKEDYQKIMLSFYRAENASQDKISGLGLGLHIAAKIIERHKGKIWLESEVGKGSTFYFAIPKSV